MDLYEERLKSLKQLSVQEIVSICKSLLPQQYRSRPYRHPEVGNGVNLLRTEDAMNAYMAAYGEMHVAKCRAALQNFPYDKLEGSIEIVDWGCGQGIGSLCALEALAQRDFTRWIKRVTLIEPSAAALGRARMNVEKATSGSVTVLTLDRYLPGHEDNVLEGLDYCARNVIHVFSNILDVDGIDLAGLARMVPRSGSRHYVLCMGPVNARAYRIDMFCKIFGSQTYFSNLADTAYGRTSDTLYTYTCKTKCFLYDGSPLDYSAVDAGPADILPVYSEYDPRLAVQNGLMSADLMRLYLILINRVELTDEDFVILQPDINGDRPDVVVVRPNKGILIINLYEHDLKEKRIPISCEYVIISQLSAIQVYQENLIHLHVQDMIGKVIADNRNWSMVKKMILFTKNTQHEVDCFFQGIDKKYTHCCGNEFLSDAGLQKKLLYELRFNYDNPQFDEKTLKSFLHIINPQWHSYKEGKNVTLSTAQGHLVDSRAGKKQKISGVAGSGKTQVLATRAVNAQIRTGRKVLILTFNKTLANFVHYRLGEVRADFPWDKIVVDYYHGFFRAQANSLGLHVYFNSYNNETFFEQVKGQTERYAAIFIDEVQDYQTVWLKLLERYFLEEGGEFVVFGDPKQNIYGRDLDANGDIRLEFIGGSWNHELRERQRFTNSQLADLATSFQGAFYGSLLPVDVFEAKEPSGFYGGMSLFSHIKYENLGVTADIDAAGDAVRRILEEEGIRAEDTVIIALKEELLRNLELHYKKWSGQLTTSTFISYEQYNELLSKYHLSEDQNPSLDYKFNNDKEAIEHNKRIHFTTNTDYLKMSTIHSFKGWESVNVILVLQAGSENKPELIYTAITRAKENLFILNLGDDRYDKFFINNVK